MRDILKPRYWLADPWADLKDYEEAMSLIYEPSYWPPRDARDD